MLIRATAWAATLLFAAGVASAAVPNHAIKKNDWIFRMRGIHVNPTDRTSSLSSVPGSGAEFHSDVMPEIDFSFFPLRHLGLEMMLTTTRHAFDGTGTLKALGEIGDTRAVVPTFTVQWHPLPGKQVRPYFGAGATYTWFVSEDASPSMSAFLGAPTRVEMDPDLGFTAQAGMDVSFTQNWMVNFDVKYVDMDTTASFETASSFDAMAMEMDPWACGFGFGYRF